MRDINKALSDIGEIRTQIAAGTSFRGYGPATIVATGVIGIATAIGQSIFRIGPDTTPALFVWSWVGAGLLSAALCGSRCRAARAAIIPVWQTP